MSKKKQPQDLALFPIRTNYPEGFETWPWYQREYWCWQQAQTTAGIAKARLEEVLQAVHLDPLVSASPEYSSLVWVLRELVHESLPTESVDDMLRQLETLFGQMRGRLAPRGSDHLKAIEGEKTKAKVKAAFDSLKPAHRLGSPVKSIATDLKLSPPTVRKHLRALGYLRGGK